MSNQNEPVPGIALFRPVENIHPDDISLFRDVFGERVRRSLGAEALQAVGRVRFSDVRPTLSVTILGAGELNGFHNHYNLPYGPDEIEALADYLDESLPQSVDKPAVMPTYPASVHFTYGVNKQWYLTLGAGENPALQERRMALDLVLNHYNLQVPRDEAWNDNERFSRLVIAAGRTAQLPEKLLQEFNDTLFEEGDIFPEVVRLAPLRIQDVERPF